MKNCHCEESRKISIFHIPSPLTGEGLRVRVKCDVAISLFVLLSFPRGRESNLGGWDKGLTLFLSLDGRG
jgi:hypothetical protein